MMLAACGGKAADTDEPLKSAGVLRVGTEGVYSPFSYHDTATNQLVGYDVDVARAVGDKLGVRVEFVETPWDSIFAALEANRFDVVANEVTITPERQAKYDLSQPYSIGEGVIVTRASDNSIKTLADLKGKVAAENATSNWSEIAARRAPAWKRSKGSPRRSSSSTRAGSTSWSMTASPSTRIWPKPTTTR